MSHFAKSRLFHFSRLAFIAVVFLFAAVAYAEVQTYSGNVRLKPESREIAADLTVNIVARDTPLSSARFYINRSFLMEKVECLECKAYTLDLKSKDTFLFMADSAPLTVDFIRPLAPGEQARIHLKYSGKIARDYPANLFTPGWTELSLYDGWFPYDPESNHFAFDIAVQVDAGYKVTGNAAVEGGRGRWRLRSGRPSTDMVLVASPNLRTRTIVRDGVLIRVDFVDADDTITDRLLGDVRKMIELYSKWYGRAATDSLTLLLSQRSAGGGYSRQGFLSMPSANFATSYDVSVLRGAGHEIAHLWWNGANASTWEDWLNESFAEYSAWRYVRATQGDAAFDKLLEEARVQSASKAPIWGIKRDSPDAYPVLYSKGPLCLYELEKELGAEGYEAFATELHSKNIKGTAAMLELLQRRSTPQVRDHFEALLKR